MSRRKLSMLQLLALVAPAILALMVLQPPAALAQNNKVMGTLQFTPETKAAKHSGVWIDGHYVGYLNELKGDKKILLLPGSHEVRAQKSGYTDFHEFVVIEPGGLKVLPVHLTPLIGAHYPGADAAQLKLDVKPKRAAVFVDNTYVGNAGHFGGLNTMILSPGAHHIAVELPGYQPFETEINLLPGQVSKLETDLLNGSTVQSGALVRH